MKLMKTKIKKFQTFTNKRAYNETNKLHLQEMKKMIIKK